MMETKKTYVRNTSKASLVIGTSEQPEGRIPPIASTRKKMVAESSADVAGFQVQTTGGEIIGEASGESNGENNGEQSTKEVGEELLGEEENDAEGTNAKVGGRGKPRKKGIGGGRGKVDIQRGRSNVWSLDQFLEVPLIRLYF